MHWRRAEKAKKKGAGDENPGKQTPQATINLYWETISVEAMYPPYSKRCIPYWVTTPLNSLGSKRSRHSMHSVYLHINHFYTSL